MHLHNYYYCLFKKLKMKTDAIFLIILIVVLRCRIFFPYFRLLVVLSVTIIVGLATFLQNFWIFFLHFMREFGIFVHHATPFAQSVIRFFEKIVGGIFILIAMVYKDLRQPKMPPLPPPPPRGFPNSGQLCIGAPNSLPPQTVPISFVPANNWVFSPEDEESDS